ncbi:MAG: serine/threonine protein kinase [Cyanobacteria bacterium P01_D01_bin.105]
MFEESVLNETVFGEPVSLHNFLRAPTDSLLCYPATKLDTECIVERIHEIKALNIEGVYCFGPKQINHWSCLGLGYCGLVLLVQCQGRVAALKVRRTDAPQNSFALEAQGLAIANRAQVGPQLFADSRNFLLMDYAIGQALDEWLLKGQSRDAALCVITRLLEQAFRLDQAGIDHGNLRCVTHHVVVHHKQPRLYQSRLYQSRLYQPVLLDFSSVSTRRRPANVTTLAQGLLWGTVIARYLKETGIEVDRQTCIQQLRAYKRSPTLNNFKRLLKLLY